MKKATDITIVLDRSGSMASIAKETILGFNAFLEEQQAVDGKATFSLVQFDHEYEPLYEALDIAEARPLTKEAYVPRGMTALLDAIGKTIKSTSKRMKNLNKGEETPKVVFVIITDGYENNSREYTRERIFRKISKLEKKHDWQFVYLGANQDAIAEAGFIGIAKEKAMTFRNDGDGVIMFMKSVSENINEVRMQDLSFKFKRGQREEQGPVGSKNDPDRYPMADKMLK